MAVTNQTTTRRHPPTTPTVAPEVWSAQPSRPRARQAPRFVRSLTRRTIVLALALSTTIVSAGAVVAYHATVQVGLPAGAGVLPGALWQRSEFFDGLTGTCGPTSLAMAESWAGQSYTSPKTMYQRMAASGLLVDANGDTTPDQIAQEARNDGFSINELPYDPNNFPLDNNTWRAFVNQHIWHEAIVLMLHNGQALVDSMSGLGENAAYLQNHVILLVGFHFAGYSPLGGRDLPTGWWAADGATRAPDHHLQFYPDAMLAAAEPFAAVTLAARAAILLAPPAPPPTPTPAQTPSAAATPAASTTPGTAAVVQAAGAGNGAAPAPFVAGTTGYDISWPQCGSPYPSPDTVAIVGVTGGRVFTQNACLADEWQAVQPATGVSVAPMAYVNTGAPVPESVNRARGQTGPRGICAATDEVCWGYNYGFNAATDALSYAASAGVDAPIWWLDVETENSWLPDPDANFAVIQGMVDAFHELGVTVGVYSTSYQWHALMGAHTLSGVPLWIAGGANLASAMRLCTDSSAWFGGGRPWLVQYPRGAFDGDAAC
jgi:hypothetical protein